MPGAVILCGRGSKRFSTCSVCHRPCATQLCDYVRRVGDVGHKKTCDAALCISCRYTPDGQQDFCPEHAKMIREDVSAPLS